MHFRILSLVKPSWVGIESVKTFALFGARWLRCKSRHMHIECYRDFQQNTRRISQMNWTWEMQKIAYAKCVGMPTTSNAILRWNTHLARSSPWKVMLRFWFDAHSFWYSSYARMHIAHTHLHIAKEQTKKIIKMRSNFHSMIEIRWQYSREIYG